MKKRSFYINLIALIYFVLMIFSCKSLNSLFKGKQSSKPNEDSVTTQINEQKATEFTNSKEDEEYIRSINSLDSKEIVSKQDFEKDKKQILQIIQELSQIMETKDVNAWLKYIDPQSKDYYSKTVNLKKAQKRLPNKAIQLNSIGDYFNYVFIPSRKRSQVDEIRYISKTNIKAVQVRDSNSIVVYYYFNKINDKWMVYLPPVTE